MNRKHQLSSANARLKEDREEKRANEVRGGRADEGCVYRSICDFSVFPFKKISFKHIYVCKEKNY